ncbi:MAG: Argininosuccinate lyase [Flavobacteriales bacterium]|nr:MAG: Argininosuccinate lyase [Flavobacteriales bacterium]
MKLWDNKNSTNQKIIEFTVGNDRSYDLHLIKYDIKASITHAKMLYKSNLLTEIECNKILDILKKMLDEANAGKLKIENEFEDMHSKIEYLLIKKLGDTGKKIHTARSRNDQVLVSIQLYLINELTQIKKEVKSLFDLLIILAKKNKDAIMPGYTHMKAAMPSSFGLWFSAFAEILIDDIISLNSTIKIVNQNTLGSAAGYGTSFNIDRNFTTKDLNFLTLKYNSLACQISRNKIEKNTFDTLGNIAFTLSKISMDICLYSGDEFQFISFPDDITTGSSIMPHKKNPDVFEIIRGKCNNIQNLSNSISLSSTNLPSGYHRDFQLNKGKIIDAVIEIKECIKILSYCLSKIKVNKKILEKSNYENIFSVELINEMVMQGIPFRDAYLKLKNKLSEGKIKVSKKVNYSHIGSIGNLALDKIKLKMKENY